MNNEDTKVAKLETVTTAILRSVGGKLLTDHVIKL